MSAPGVAGSPTGVDPRAVGRGTRGERIAGSVRAIGLVGAETVRLGYDRLARRRPVPATIDGLDAAALSRLLGRPIDRVDPLDRTEGTTDRVRLALDGRDVPASVFVKMAPAAARARLFTGLAELGATEVGFYREIRPGLALEAPRALAAVHDARTRRFVLVLDDLEARGCRFPELVDGCAPGDAEAALDTLARLHAAHGEDAALAGRDGLRRFGWVPVNSESRLLPLVTAALGWFAPRLGRDDPTLVPPDGAAILAAYPAVARTLDAGPHTILHGDPHPRNWYVDGDRVGLLDWQAVRRGVGLRDVAYLIVLALTPEDRRLHERRLLDTYRAMAAYPYVAAAFTAGIGGLHDQATAREGLRRAAAAIVELATASALAVR